MTSTLKAILVYYVFSFFIGTYLANGTTVLFQQELGFSFTQIFFLSGFYMLMFVLLEIPSGALADLVGRKKTLFFGCMALTGAAVFTGLSSDFFVILASFFVWAVGFSLISGANEALLYDKLEDNDRYADVLGRSQAVWLIGTALAGILGPFLFTLNFRFAYLFSAVPFFIAGIVILFFPEDGEYGEFHFRRHVNQIKLGIRRAFTNPYIRWAMLVLALTFGINYTFSNSYQPYLVDIGFPVKRFSFILPVMFVFEALGGSVSGKVRKLLGETLMFRATLVALTVLIAFLGIWDVKLALLLLFAYTFLNGLVRPLISTYSNRCLQKEYRSTVISTQNQLATATAAVMLFGFGFLTDRIGLSNVLMFLGGVSLVAVILLLIFKPEGNEPERA